jgi:hypothetical protein
MILHNVPHDLTGPGTAARLPTTEDVMAGEPNELPEGGEGGGGWGGLGGWRGEYPAELPVGPDFGLSAVLKEILAVRSRLQQLEDMQITAALSGAASGARMAATAYRIYRPEELPEGGEGGGGGWPWGGWRGEFPQELPAAGGILQRVQELETQLAGITASLQRIEGQVGKLGGQVTEG